MANGFLRAGVLLGALLGSTTMATAQSTEDIRNAPDIPVPQTTPSGVWHRPAAILFDSGPLVTHVGGGAGGADASRLQNSSLSMTTLGFGHQISSNNSVADDFTVPAAGWGVTQITFFGYQTGSTTTSTINAVQVRIWNGPPNGGGTVIWGDLATNRLASTSFANVYRDSETSVGNNQRPIMAVVATVPTTLTAGTYWVEWRMGGTLASGPWAPPITVTGQTTTGNALQNLAGVWGAANDGGSATGQGFKFIIEGSVLPVELQRIEIR